MDQIYHMTDAFIQQQRSNGRKVDRARTKRLRLGWKEYERRREQKRQQRRKIQVKMENRERGVDDGGDTVQGTKVDPSAGPFRSVGLYLHRLKLSVEIQLGLHQLGKQKV